MGVAHEVALDEATTSPCRLEEIRNAMRKTTRTPRRKREPEVTDEQWEIGKKTAIYCLMHFPMLWTVGGVPQLVQDDTGGQRWVIPVALRYPTGHGGEIGQLAYDGKEFTLLTDRAEMNERSRKIADDPEHLRKWNEHLASSLPAGES